MYDIHLCFPVLQKTPLYRACESGHLTAVNVLMENGADVTALNEHMKLNCLEVAVENGHKYVVHSTARYTVKVVVPINCEAKIGFFRIYNHTGLYGSLGRGCIT